MENITAYAYCMLFCSVVLMIYKSALPLIVTFLLSALECVFEVRPAPLRMSGHYFTLETLNMTIFGQRRFCLLFLKR